MITDVHADNSPIRRRRQFPVKRKVSPWLRTCRASECQLAVLRRLSSVVNMRTATALEELDVAALSDDVHESTSLILRQSISECVRVIQKHKLTGTLTSPLSLSFCKARQYS